MMKLYGSSGPLATCTRRVEAVLKEKEVSYELVQIDFAKGEHKQPWFFEKQPFGQIPFFVDGEFVLFESRAICRYIALKYADRGMSLIPPISDLVATAKFEEAASIEQNNFDVYALGIATELIFKPFKGEGTDQKLVEQYTTVLASKLDVYEVILTKQKYLAGDTLTLADLFHLPYGQLLTERLGYDFLTSNKRPSVSRWWKDISSRPSWLAVDSRT